MSFWNDFKKPIVGLAPMDGVTDAPMRFITAKYGKPDVIFTEFVSAEALARVVDGRIKKPEVILKALKYSDIERPVVAQLFGKDPEAFYVATKKVVELGFDGVDINMGCPSKNVTDNGSGAGLINNRELAGKIIAAVKRAVSECHSDTVPLLPVSVKTRVGTLEPDESWWEFLADQELAAVTMHGRTFKQLYRGLADWESLAKAAKIIKESGSIFLGNGDISDMEDFKFKMEKYDMDGGLIGRAAMGNPWIFDPNFKFSISNFKLKMQIMVEHARKYDELFPDETFFAMRKHLSYYAKGFENAVELRRKLVLANSADEVEQLVVFCD